MRNQLQLYVQRMLASSLEKIERQQVEGGGLEETEGALQGRGSGVLQGGLDD